MIARQQQHNDDIIRCNSIYIYTYIYIYIHRERERERDYAAGRGQTLHGRRREVAAAGRGRRFPVISA